MKVNLTAVVFAACLIFAFALGFWFASRLDLQSSAQQQSGIAAARGTEAIFSEAMQNEQYLGGSLFTIKREDMKEDGLWL